MPGPLLAVDGPSLLYRAFYALPDSIRGADGTPVNALLGSVNAILRVCADRPAVPEGLAPQFEAAPLLCEALRWGSATTPELEADDLLGAFAAAEAAAGGAALLMTGDRDLYQCASPSVAVLYLKTGVRGFEEVGPEEVERRYGIPPALVPDFIALRGDPSDGLPGAKGIGEKTAADLLRRHGSLEAAIAGADGEKPRIAAALSGQAEELRTFKDVATLREPPVERPPDAGTDLQRGARAARALGMRRLAERLEKAGSVAEL